MLITLYKIGELHFRLLGTNGFHVKAKSERFTAASSRCRQNLKYENFTSSFGRLVQKIAPKSVPLVQDDYFSLFNQSNDWFVILSLTSSSFKFPDNWLRPVSQKILLERKKYMHLLQATNWRLPSLYNSLFSASILATTKKVRSRVDTRYLLGMLYSVA